MPSEKVSAYDLAIGQRVWYQGTGWVVEDIIRPRGEPRHWVLRTTDGRRSIELGKRDKVWVRVPHPFERRLAPGVKRKGRDGHRWRLVVGGRGRLCEVCGRGEAWLTTSRPGKPTRKGWRRVS